MGTLSSSGDLTSAVQAAASTVMDAPAFYRGSPSHRIWYCGNHVVAGTGYRSDRGHIFPGPVAGEIPARIWQSCAYPAELTRRLFRARLAVVS
jgi:hypothetical protein